MRTFAFMAVLLLSLPAHALEVFATVPEWAALASAIGGGKVNVFSATHALQDPHHVDARPSLIARARRADLVAATGAELEVGWLPVVLRESGNPRIQPGQPGHFEAAAHVRMLDVPTRLDRAEGDVHAAGNPHIQTDPRNFLKVGEALARRFAELDPANAAAYRSGFDDFARGWREALGRWEKQAAPLKGLPVVVQHKSWPYLLDWLGMKEVAALEPKPGVEPSAAHLSRLVESTKGARMVLRAACDNPRPAEWFSAKAGGGVPVAVLPFTVGGSEGAKDLFSLFDDTIRRLLEASR
ncbi:MAG: zinc ABC transporter substrate-binding protein [Candidatus Nitricoxidivorans perseverans]|uniref:Zinc ABC transporter substrate-binding protein n=1 Tax=Candidatus Nitricoxidivorans perseverans TaxID=2975601 RepID=A0AA49FIC4_9PROT|nr:MAG: zinc ABC transporter substrate-binding protein [Candidatus Nitricoxidivorans perseverans]